MNLNNGTCLHGGKYVIVKELGRGGFGITYLAEHIELKRKVAIKEFFMGSYCSRDEETTEVQLSKAGKDTFDVYLKKFVKEAQTIASLDNPHIIRIFDIFEENNTAYYVMEYLSGGTLTERIPEGGMDAEQAARYIRQVAVALDYLHQYDIMHLDVKPGNILFKRDVHNRDSAVLIDFGLAKHYDKESKDQTTDTPIGISEGYAPLEQYETDGVKKFQPATDIYALGATLYHLLVGKRPPAASNVQKGLPPFQKPLPDYIKRTVQKAMMSSKEDRPQSVATFLEYLDVSDETPADETPAWMRFLTGKGYKPLKYTAIGVVSLLVLFFFIGVAVESFKEDREQTSEVTEVVKTEEKTRSEAEYRAAAKLEAKKKAAENEAAANTEAEDAVDLGLSVKWASADLGGYFAWGHTKTGGYTMEDCKTMQKDLKGIAGNKEYDAAAYKWGEGWRLPTKDEVQELIDNCKWAWTHQDGKDGYRVTGKNGNFIFLPANGHMANGKEMFIGERGYYQTGVSDNNKSCWILYFDGWGVKLMPSMRYQGNSIRPVKK